MTDTQILPLTKLEQMLAEAKTPAESFNVEAIAKANMALHKEQRDYEKAFEDASVYIRARCNTTELITPTIYHGPHRWGNRGDDIVTSTTLEDYGFTKKQWERRRKELEAVDRFDEYQDDCVEKRVLPTPFGLVGFCFRNYHVSDDSYEWYTPREYIEAARGVMGGIDLDPASSDEAQEIVQADRYYTKQDDGLSQSWAGKVWLNPPYNMPLIEDFTGKAIDEYQAGNIECAIVLVNNATDTGWFHRLFDYPVCFTRRRVQFWTSEGPNLGARQGQAIFYLGGNPDLFAQVFSAFGVVLRKYDD
jgi:phage N-6-adenine-methyltransferase